MTAKRLVLSALLVAGVLTACGKDDVKPASSGDPTTTTEAPSTPSTTTSTAPTETTAAP